MNHRTNLRRALTIAALLSTLPAAVEAQARRYVHFQQGGQTGWGLLEGESIQRLSAAPWAGGTPSGQTVALSAVTLLPPAVPRTAVITTVNFPSAGDRRDMPTIITLPHGAFVGSGSPILRPVEVENLQAEPTVAVVIGRTATSVTPEEAPQYILGVAPAIAVTAVDWRTGQWTRAMGADSFKPIGPAVVAGVDYNNLTVQGRHNGTALPPVRTADMYYDFNELVSFVSGYMTLNPGDVILAGTAGEGASVSVRAGDTLEVDIAGVGTLRTPVVADRPMTNLPPRNERPAPEAPARGGGAAGAGGAGGAGRGGQ